MNKNCALGSCFLVVAAIVLFIAGCGKDNETPANNETPSVQIKYSSPLISDGRPEVNPPIPEVLRKRGWKPMDFSDQPSLNISIAQSNEVAEALAHVIEAYTNGTTALMKERIDQLPKYFSEIGGFRYCALMTPLWRAAKKFWFADTIRQFEDVEDLEKYFTHNLGMIRFICDGETKRYSEYPVLIEWRVLALLQKYRAFYRKLARVDMEKAVTRYLDEWIVHIESENGYTRRAAWMQVSLQYRNIVEGRWSCEELFRWARRKAFGLNNCGYTPKWLDEEFPLLPEDSAEKK